MVKITKWRGAGVFIGAGPDKRAGAPTQSRFAAGALLQEEVRSPANCPHSALLTGPLPCCGHWIGFQLASARHNEVIIAPTMAFWHQARVVSRTDAHSSAKAISQGPHLESLHPRQHVLDGDG